MPSQSASRSWQMLAVIVTGVASILAVAAAVQMFGYAFRPGFYPFFWCTAASGFVWAAVCFALTSVLGIRVLRGSVARRLERSTVVVMITVGALLMITLWFATRASVAFRNKQLEEILHHTKT